MRKDCQIACLYGGSAKPWFIVESYATSDGVRTRICDGWYGSRVEAQNVCDWKNRD